MELSVNIRIPVAVCREEKTVISSIGAAWSQG